jgi:hypothetical protein
MRRASRGRLEAPVSWSEVGGKEAESWERGWVFGWVEDWVGGLGFAALEAVAGGVDMPFCRASAAGEAMVVVW